MSLYLIGDLQGCNAPLQRLLVALDFSPSRDTLYLLGDLVNRGPDSLAVLRRLHALGDAAQCLLGNHDLHALAVWQGVRLQGKSDTLDELLAAPDCDALMDWLRHRAMAIHKHGWLMVHAGVLPQWTALQTMALAREVEHALQGHNFKDFLSTVFGNQPSQWHNSLEGVARLRVVVNALTRLRFCTPDGEMEFSVKGGQADAPPGYARWFEVPNRATLGQPLAFGHWSTLNAGQSMHHNTLALDTGCVWGGCLTAAKLGSFPGEFELIQIKCEQAQLPTASAAVT
jgi:bis(5'-nucleosyl)-tetraphosphatase (symmetrical)